MDPVQDHDEISADAKRFATTLDYDFMKQVSTLALAALGGVVTFAGSIFAEVSDKRGLWLSAALFAVAAVTSFQAQDNIVRRVSAGRAPDWRYRVLRTLAVGGLGIGAGVLLGFAYRVLS
ncbi:hypothetical protein ACFOMD_04165 [Sphingoaurantiacus capsulatus]|uniref:Uncharacterized protein n=1 Tax=Sphingoaurantiacus capsulatus TaxID=1771310 RepID=A0ABV7X6L6_9SPHN